MAALYFDGLHLAIGRNQYIGSYAPLDVAWSGQGWDIAEPLWLQLCGCLRTIPGQERGSQKTSVLERERAKQPKSYFSLGGEMSIQ
jgi:hypothetical protein